MAKPNPFETPQRLRQPGSLAEKRRQAQRERAYRDWFGDDYYALELEATQDRASRLGDLLDGILEGLDTEDRRTVRKLVDRWSEIVGVEIARHTAPRAISNPSKPRSPNTAS